MARKTISSESNQHIDPPQWVDRHGDLLYRFALIRVRDPHVAEDLVQITFLAAWESKDRFQGSSSEPTWLISILKHKIMDHFRRGFRETPAGDLLETIPNASHNSGGKGGVAMTIPKNNTPDVLLEQQEFWTGFQNCLDYLPEKPRSLFILREVEGLSTEEICKELNLTPTNLWVILHRMRTQLKQCLERKGFHKPPAGLGGS